MIALTKTLDPADLDDPAMRDQLVIVDKHFDLEHVQRRWEYALALEAITQWEAAAQRVETDHKIADVGGSGSPFYLMVPGHCITIDPQEGDGVTRIAAGEIAGYGGPVEELAGRLGLVEGPFDCVISISTCA